MSASPTQTTAHFRSPRRISVTLPYNAFSSLQSRSDEEGRSLSNLAAFLIESSLEDSREPAVSPWLDARARGRHF